MSHPITRRAACVLGAAALGAPSAFARPSRSRIEQWGLYEIALKGPNSGNPFLDVKLDATFENGDKSIRVSGFYDGDGVYRIRFMPVAKGQWRYRTSSNVPALDGKSGSFEANTPSPANHGPVAVANTYHFAYADGTVYRPFGTTSYACTHQPDAMCELTLKTLAVSPFNKLRLAVFPNSTVPAIPLYAFEGAPRAWDYSRFNPVFFQRLEKFVGRLHDLGIEADIILFHPYDGDKWDYDKMPAEVDDRYARYIVARLAAFRNVWWSMANEYDVMKAKTDADFDRLFQVVRDNDPYGHLRSIHNLNRLYNNSQPWVTHASIQNGAAVEDDARALLHRDVWRKPVVFDEVKYEGNLTQRWGNLTPEEFIRRCWEGTVGGTYVGHGESIEDKDHHMWLGEGGVLKGKSPIRMGFLRRILEEGPRQIDPIDRWQSVHLGGEPGSYYLRYFGDDAPKEWALVLPREGVSDGQKFTVDILDTWEMTVTPVPEPFTMHKADNYTFAADRPVPLPQKKWIALRIRKV